MKLQAAEACDPAYFSGGSKRSKCFFFVRWMAWLFLISVFMVLRGLFYYFFTWWIAGDFWLAFLQVGQHIMFFLFGFKGSACGNLWQIPVQALSRAASPSGLIRPIWGERWGGLSPEVKEKGLGNRWAKGVLLGPRSFVVFVVLLRIYWCFVFLEDSVHIISLSYIYKTSWDLMYIFVCCLFLKKRSFDSNTKSTPP